LNVDYRINEGINCDLLIFFLCPRKCMSAGYWRFLKYCLISEFNFLIITSFHLPSSRHRLSNDDFMEDTREDYLLYAVVYYSCA